VLNHLAEQLKTSPTQVTKKGRGSYHIAGFTKQQGDSGPISHGPENSH
jgi:hypothetical protein